MTNKAVKSAKEETIIGILAGTDRRLKQWRVRPHPTKPGFTLYSYTLNADNLPVADEMDLSLQFGADYHAEDAADRNNAIEKLKLLKAEGFLETPDQFRVRPNTAQALAAVSQMTRSAFNDQAGDAKEQSWLELSDKIAEKSMAYWWAHSGDAGVQKCIENMQFFHNRQPGADYAEVYQNLDRFYAQAIIAHVCSGLDMKRTGCGNLIPELQTLGDWMAHPLHTVANAILFHFQEKYKATSEFKEITLRFEQGDPRREQRFSSEFYAKSLRTFFALLSKMMLSPTGEFIEATTPPAFLNSKMQESYREAVAKLTGVAPVGKSIHDVPASDIKPGDKVDYDTELGNVLSATIQSIEYFVDRALIRIVVEIGPDETRTARFEHGDGTKVTMR